MKNKKNIFGFTLVELLLAISIIAVIASLSLLAYGSIRQKSRDTRRVKDIEQIQTALKLYFYNEGSYPTTLSFGQSLLGSTSSTTYMAILPNNPESKNDGVCNDQNYTYQISPTSTDYKVSFCLSSPVGSLKAGPKCLTSKGIIDMACDIQQCDNNIEFYGFTSCGTSGTYGEEEYPTVQVGTQCWMAKNLNIGSNIGSAANINGYDNITGNTDDCTDVQPNEYACDDIDSDGICDNCSDNNGDNICDENDIWSCQGARCIQKYCYNNSNTNCDADGGLYEWAEALNLPSDCNNAPSVNNGDNTYTVSCPISGNQIVSSKQQGVCPIGWHVPSDDDWTVLTGYLNANSEYWCDGTSSKIGKSLAGTSRWLNGFDWTPAGLINPCRVYNFLNNNNYSNFNAVPSGLRYSNPAPASTFHAINYFAWFWSSSPSVSNQIESWHRVLGNSYYDLNRSVGGRTQGESVRCIKN
ncbi:MAG: FISUMP domain-containing protein [Candidatus Falkowbacteria bacterium]